MNNNCWIPYLSRHLAVVILIYLCWSQSLLAETIIVNSTADEVQANGQCTLREALANANNDSMGTGDCAAGSGDDVIDLTNISGTITLAEELKFLSNINLLGPGDDIPEPGDDKLILDGNDCTRVLYVGEDVIVEIEKVWITEGGDRSSSSSGGGIFNAGTLTLTKSVVFNNFAEDGGGIFNQGNLTLTNSKVLENTAKDQGGGIYNRFGSYRRNTVTLKNSTVSDNIAERDGGGIFNQSTSRGESTLSLVNSMISDNFARRYGGGIFNFEGTLTLINSTVSMNYTERNGISKGGGIFNFNIGIGTLTLRNSTIFENEAHFGGGIFNGALYGPPLYDDDVLIFQNALITDNDPGGDCLNKGNSPTVISSFISDNTCEATFNGDPQLDLWAADNGGPTETHALLVGSPAIDAGDANYCPETDQRGVTRPQGAGCDIGAFEFDEDQDLDQDG